MKMKFIVGMGLLATLSLNSCEQDKDLTDKTLESLQEKVLNDEAKEVMIPTYKLLVSRAEAMKAAIKALRATPTAETLEAARNAWRESRIPWEQSEAFLFGPTGDNGIDPALDSWPVDVSAMTALINSNKPITAEVLQQNNEARGFHLVEFLLWGENNKNVSELTPRQMEYLEAAAQDILDNANKLVEYWTPYANQLGQAGKEGNTKYPSKDAGFQQLVAGMIDISNEVGSSKIEKPLNGDLEAGSHDNHPHPDLEESRFSHNSKRDYINNIESIANVYEGKFQGKDVSGIDDVIVMMALKDKSLAVLNSKIIAQIKAAQKAIEAIPGTFTEAIQADNASGREAVKAAQQETEKLTHLLEELNNKAFHAAPEKEEA